LVDRRENNSDPVRPSPTGPWGAPRNAPPAKSAEPPRVHVSAKRRPTWSAIFFCLVILSVGIRAYRDLSRPEAWDYWKESFFSPSMTSSMIEKSDLDGRPALAIRGTIGVASASWLRDRIDQAHLSAGDLVLVSSPGGDLDQALIMGEIIRSHGLATAVGTADTSGHLTKSYCASACVLVYAGGQPRYGIEGSVLGVHRFTTSLPGRDPIADAQRITGTVLSYMTKMGVSSAIVEAMSATRDIRWLSGTEASTMNLVTNPVRQLETVRR